jgi:EGF domain
VRKLVASALIPSFAALALLACSDDGAQISDPGTPEADAATNSDSGKPGDVDKPDSGVDAGPSCAKDNGGCDPNALCESTSGKVVCTCKTGYEGDGKSCRDVDECATDNGGCLEKATCANTDGGHTCTCNPGYFGDGVLACNDVDECAANNGGCNANATCANTVGGHSCTCNTGYSGNGVTCDDVDECAADNGGCNANATCANTMGSRTCSCNVGYTGTGVGADCALATTTFAANTNLSTTNTGDRVCADGGDMVSYSVVALTATTAKVASTVGAGCLTIGDSVLLINLQGTSASVSNVGTYETLTVTNVTGDVVTFRAKTKFFGATSGQDDAIGIGAGAQRVVLQRIPRYGNVVVAANTTLTANGWSGLKGGIFALSAAGSVTVNGTIDMSAKGFAGGVRTTVESTTGQQGESTRGLGIASMAPSGGGGGGGGGDAWCATYGVGGGGGGYGTNGTAFTVCTSPGVTYGTADLSKLFFGSGGGAGGTDNTFGDNPQGAAGGNGGGIVFIHAAGAVTGSIRSIGGNGEGDPPGVECFGTSVVDCWDYSGPGGGGAGGSILVNAQSFAGTASVSGGSGGNGYNWLAGDGGSGGSGRVKIP